VTYFIPAYLLIAASYALASWLTFSTDPKNETLMAAYEEEGTFLKILVLLVYAVLSVSWPFALLTHLFVKLFRNK